MRDITVSARISQELGQQLDTLAQSLRRSRSWVIEEALRGYITSEMQFIEAVNEGIRAADVDDVVDHEVVMAEMDALLQQSTTRQP